MAKIATVGKPFPEAVLAAQMRDVSIYSIVHRSQAFSPHASWGWRLQLEVEPLCCPTWSASMPYLAESRTNSELNIPLPSTTPRLPMRLSHAVGETA